MGRATCPECGHSAGMHIIPEKLDVYPSTCGYADCSCQTPCLSDGPPARWGERRS